MADEELVPPEGSEEPIVLPDESKPEEVVLPTVEELAQKAGWTPKEEFKGDPEKWKPADEFLLVGKDRIRAVDKELKSVKDQMGRMTRVSETLYQQQLREQDEKWRARMQEAFEAGDADGFNKADEQRGIIARQASEIINQPAPEVQDFATRHSVWFNKDPMATQYAFQVCEMNKHLSAEQQLSIAEAEVKKRFPEHFKAEQQGKAPAQVNAPNSRGAGRSNGKAKAFHDMPKDAQDAAIKFEADHGVTKEKYTELYWKREGAVQ